VPAPAKPSPAWKAGYNATRPKFERKTSHLTRRKQGGRRARVRDKPKVSADVALLAAAVNLARLAALGLASHGGHWAANTA
jgi:IS5 family transposase